MGRPIRPARVGAVIREVVGEALSTRLSDPAIRAAGLVSVTEVDVSADLGVATVYVVAEAEAPAQREALLEGLRRASSRLRSLVARRTRMRRTPELRFSLDESILHGRRIDSILKELEDDA